MSVPGFRVGGVNAWKRLMIVILARCRFTMWKFGRRGEAGVGRLGYCT